MKLTCPSIDI